MKDILRGLGLTENQAKLYIELLSGGEQTAAGLAKCCRLNRSTAYQELDVLVSLGLVGHMNRDYRRWYRAAPPEKLLEMMETKKNTVKGALPELKRLQQQAKTPATTVQVFEGAEGLKMFFRHLLEVRPDETLALGVTGYAFEQLQYTFPQLLKRYVRAGMKARYLANADARERLRKTPQKLATIKYLPAGFTGPVTTIIYSDFVAVLSLRKENSYVLLIRDGALAEAYRGYFNLLWERL